MIKDKEKFSADLKDFFRGQGLSQNDIAARFGVSQSYVGMLMTGKKEFGKNTAQQWADEFGLSVAWLLTGEGDMLQGKLIQQNNQNGDNFQGEGFTVNKGDTEFFALLRKKDEQIDRLLTIIEKMQDESKS